MKRLARIAPVWPQGLLALLVLAPLFFWSYGLANRWAAAQRDVPSVVFAWEAHIPLWPWTILPYWSIDLFYGLSLLIAPSLGVLGRHAARLLTAQLLCVSCFMLWPLRFVTPRPPLGGWEGALFDALTGFDLPYNQAPSLHIVLLLILWDFYRRLITGLSTWVLHGWSLLIGLSVLTTYQHHAIDIPTGLLAGAVCMWLWPLQGPLPWHAWRSEPGSSRLAWRYGTAALVCAALAWGWGVGWHRTAWLLFWPAVALGWVAASYAGFGQGVFQKDGQGRLSVAASLLLWPYRAMAWVNARCWTWRLPSSVEVDDGVWLGRLPLPWEVDHARFTHVLDVTAELQSTHGAVRAVPMLDLVVPAPARLREAADELSVMRDEARGPILVACALGLSRSAAVVLTWLCVSGKARDVQAAMGLLRARRPQVVLSPALLDAVRTAVGEPVGDGVWAEHGSQGVPA